VVDGAGIYWVVALMWEFVVLALFIWAVTLWVMALFAK